MTFFNSLLIVLFLSVVLVSGHCFSGKDVDSSLIESEKTESYGKLEEETEMNKESVMFQEVVGISKYAAAGAVDRLHEAGCGVLKEVELISDQKGYTVKVVDENDQIYYAGLGGLGYLELIRRDSPDGEIVYAVIDDLN